jgi:DNA-binding XRE family transcriptional regulator
MKKKLVRARSKRRWSAAETCRRAGGLHRFTLQRLESGESAPGAVSVTTAVSLIRIFDELTLEDFVGKTLAKGNTILKEVPR